MLSSVVLLVYVAGERAQGVVPHPDQPALELALALRGEGVEVARAARRVLNEPGVGEHAQVLADRGAADGQPARELADGQRTLAQALDDAPAHGIAEGVEGAFRGLVAHG